MLEDTSDRKIAVIFATDVVGYSKSIEQNENYEFAPYVAK